MTTSLVVYDQIIEFDTLTLEQQAAALSRSLQGVEETFNSRVGELNQVLAKVLVRPEVKAVLNVLSELDREIESLQGYSTHASSQAESPQDNESLVSARSGFEDKVRSMTNSAAQANLVKAELKKLYRQLAQLTHPDSNKSDAETRKLFPIIERAYREADVTLLRNLKTSVLDYLSTKKSNKKRKNLIRENLKKLSKAKQMAEQRLREFNASDAGRLISAYETFGLDAAAQLHLTVLSNAVTEKSRVLNTLKSFRRASVSTTFSSVQGFFNNVF